jgi:hypothetical protein
MRDGWSDVKEIAYSMTAVCPVYRKPTLVSYLPILFYILAYNIADLSVHSARLTYFEGFLKRVIGLFDQKFARFGDLAYQISFIEVDVHAVLINSNIEVDYVSILQRSHVGYSMAYYLVDGCT